MKVEKKIIAHRANLKGPSDSENTVRAVHMCFEKGFDVELDVWYTESGGFWLGHDRPQHDLFLATDLLLDKRVWCHAKNLAAAVKLREIGAHYFWHQNDDFTLTSKGFFWTYPGAELCSNSIAVMPEMKYHEASLHLVYGLCTDFPLRYIDYE